MNSFEVELLETIKEIVQWLDEQIEWWMVMPVPELVKHIRTTLRPVMFTQHRSLRHQLKADEYKFMDHLFNESMKLFIKDKYCHRWAVMDFMYPPGYDMFA